MNMQASHSRVLLSLGVDAKVLAPAELRKRVQLEALASYAILCCFIQ